MYCLCTFSWMIYIWKAKAVSSYNQLTLIISHSLHAISLLLRGEILEVYFVHWDKLNPSFLIFSFSTGPSSYLSTALAHNTGRRQVPSDHSGRS